ncbi:hypothetical protein BpHYR1_002897 [Brachionus plicatilis]|uniref:Uncharacterized protein n=1 Tax=Brachionus plicatilis TaxID=10195 RepID=A0A3M7QB61_BRAPC|nr:hypothetical protein BpHYR1_002897 [Brachionus plicatilis]
MVKHLKNKIKLNKRLLGLLLDKYVELVYPELIFAYAIFALNADKRVNYHIWNRSDKNAIWTLRDFMVGGSICFQMTNFFLNIINFNQLSFDHRARLIFNKTSSVAKCSETCGTKIPSTKDQKFNDHISPISKSRHLLMENLMLDIYLCGFKKKTRIMKHCELWMLETSRGRLLNHKSSDGRFVEKNAFMIP